jgi:hypothetical protein
MPRTRIPSGGGNDFVREHNVYDFRDWVPTTGNIFVVDSTQTAGSGLSPEDPKVTLAAAESALTTNNNDVIYVMDKHVESFAGAAACTLAKSGTTWVGLGVGRSRPTFTWTTAIGAQMVVSGSDVTIRNMVFDFTGFDAITAAISVTGADVAFEDCEFVTNSATAGCVLGILTAATAARLRIERCRFVGPAANTGTTTTAQIKHEVGVDYVIKDCYFTGKMTQAILNATALLRGQIHNNVFVVATGTVAITMHASSTPMITNNRINVPSGTTPITAAAGFVAGNIYSAAAGVTAGTASTI